MKKFIIHYTKLVERCADLIEQFERENITDYEFIIGHDREDLTPHDRRLFDTSSMHDSSIAITNAHLYALSLVAKNHENALILEDDVILDSGFNGKLDHYLLQLPTDYDMAFIGSGCNLHIEPHALIPGQNIYRKNTRPTSWGGNGATRCTDSYIVSKKCAAKICEYASNLPMGSINRAIDWWLNEVIRIHDFKVYWAEPTIVKQGSQSGIFKTSHH